jgi:hypothetical protein
VRNIRDMCGKYYHGYDKDQVGQVKQFLEAKFRFRVLWENNHGERCNYISEGFGSISGLTRGSIEKVIYQTTLSGSKTLEGRSILKKAKAAMDECRILLAYWLEFAVDGDFPSGQNEEDALRYVLNRSYADKSNDLDDDDDDEVEETFRPQNEDDNRSQIGSDDGSNSRNFTNIYST